MNSRNSKCQDPALELLIAKDFATPVEQSVRGTGCHFLGPAGHESYKPAIFFNRKAKICARMSKLLQSHKRQGLPASIESSCLSHDLQCSSLLFIPKKSWNASFQHIMS